MAQVESRRFRTWDVTSRPTNARLWGLVVRYGLLRMSKNWIFWVLFGAAMLGGIFAMLAVTSPYGLTQYAVMEANIFGFFVDAAFVLLILSPLIAEDLRFNAHIFYFSRPLRARDYLVGKLALGLCTFGVVALVPLIMTAVGVLVAPQPDQRFVFEGEEYIDTFGERIYVASTLVVGGVTNVILFTTLALAASSLVKRAWHAAVGLVAVLGVWGMLGAIAGDALQDTTQFLTSPLGWASAMLFLPVESLFSEASYYENAQMTVLAAHVLSLVLSALCVWLLAWRSRRLEAAA